MSALSSEELNEKVRELVSASEVTSSMTIPVTDAPSLRRRLMADLQSSEAGALRWSQLTRQWSKRCHTFGVSFEEVVASLCSDGSVLVLSVPGCPRALALRSTVEACLREFLEVYPAYTQEQFDLFAYGSIRMALRRQAR